MTDSLKAANSPYSGSFQRNFFRTNRGKTEFSTEIEEKRQHLKFIHKNNVPYAPNFIVIKLYSTPFLEVGISKKCFFIPSKKGTELMNIFFTNLSFITYLIKSGFDSFSYQIKFPSSSVLPQYLLTYHWCDIQRRC